MSERSGVDTISDQRLCAEAKPDEKVAEFLRQLILLGNNLDRLLTKAYLLGYIDTPLLQSEMQKWNQFQLAVEKEFLCPEKSDLFGNK